MFGAILPIARENLGLPPFRGGRLTSDSRPPTGHYVPIHDVLFSLHCLPTRLRAIIHIILLLTHQGSVYQSVDRRWIGTISRLAQNCSCGRDSSDWVGWLVRGRAVPVSEIFLIDFGLWVP